MLQPTTGEVVVELLGDEARQMGAVFGDLTQELTQELLYDRVERRFLRLFAGSGPNWLCYPARVACRLKAQ